MPFGKDVKPKKWSNLLILFDDREVSYCFGNYEGSLYRVVGTRYNHNYPTLAGHPVWYVEPGMMNKVIVEQLLKTLLIIKDVIYNRAINPDLSLQWPMTTKYLQSCIPQQESRSTTSVTQQEPETILDNIDESDFSLDEINLYISNCRQALSEIASR